MKPPSSNRLSPPIPAKALDSLVALAVELVQWEVQISHRVQAKAERLAHDQLRRQERYKEFIEQASELYIHALQNGKPDVSALMRLYASRQLSNDDDAGRAPERAPSASASSFAHMIDGWTRR
jgi:hypothetical protein